jgi:hypothetical protein
LVPSPISLLRSPLSPYHHCTNLTPNHYSHQPMTICLPPPLIPEEPQTPEEPQVFLGKSILMSPPPVTASHLALVKSAATTASLCSAGKCEPIPLLFTNAAM